MVLNKYRIRCITENIYVYTWGEIKPTACPNNNNDTIDNDLTSIINTISELNTGSITGTGKASVSGFNSTIFGDGRTVNYTPIIQNYAPYGTINNQLYTMIQATGGTITSHTNGIEIELKTANSIGSYAVLRSKKILKNRPGLTNIYRGSVKFDTPVALSLQFTGLGNAGGDLYFAYTGTVFGVRHSTDGRAEIRKLTINNISTSNQDLTITLDGVAYIISITDSSSKVFTTYQISIYVFPGWLVESIDDSIYFISRSVGPRNGSYSCTSTGDMTCNFEQLATGTVLNTTIIPQGSWNGTSDMIINLDPLKNNLYEIEYTCFGASSINFKVVNPASGEFEIVHTLTFANTSSSPSLTQPNLFIQEGVASLGATTPLIVTSSSSFAATMGPIQNQISMFSIHVEKSIISNTETVLISIKNRVQLNKYVNHGEIKLKKITIAVNGSKSVKVNIYKNPTTLSAGTITDFINYQYIDENNALGLYNTDSNTFTGGILIDTFYIGKESSIIITDNIILNQFDTVFITAFSTTTNVVDVSVSLVDDF